MDNVEEDIKLLERFNPGDEYTERIKQAIENILAEREADKKRIKELEEQNKKYIIHLTDRQYRKTIENAQKEIKEKYENTIKELEEENATLRKVNKITKDINIEEAAQKIDNYYKEFLQNFIPTQKVKENIEKHKIAKEGLEKEYNNKKYEDDDLRASDFYGIVTQDRIIQVLEELLEDK